MPDESTPDREPPIEPFLTLLHPESVVLERVHRQAFLHYVQAVHRIVQSASKEPGSGLSVQLAVALLPDRRPVVALEAFPTDVKDPRLDTMSESIAQLGIPPVKGGPVAFVVFDHFAGGAKLPPTQLRLPFIRLANEFKGGTLDVLIYQAAGLPVPENIWLESVQLKEKIDEEQRAIEAQQTPLPWWRRLWAKLQKLVSSEPAITEANAAVDEPPTVDVQDDPVDPDSWTIETLTAAIEKQPTVLQYRRLRARLYAQGERWDEAIADYDFCLAQDAADVRARAERGVCYLQMKRYQPALVDFNAALAILPDDQMALLGRADVYRELEAWSSAEQDLSRLVELVPGDARFLYFRAQNRAALGKGEAAVDDLDAAITADPNDADTYAARGRLKYRAAIDPATCNEALEDMLTAARLAPERLEYWTTIGELQLQLNQVDEAAETSRCALEIDPQYGPALGIRGMVENLRDGPADDIVRDCTAALDAGYAPPMVYMARAAAHGRQRNWYAALEDLTKLIEVSPEFVDAWNARGVVRAQLDLDDLAKEDFERAIELAPESPEGYLNRGTWLLEQGNRDGARDDFSRAIELQPNAPFGYWRRAQVHEAEERLDLAERDFNRAMRLNRGLAQIACDRGVFFARTGKFDDALDDFAKALEYSPDHKEARFHRAQTLMFKGDFATSLAEWNKLIVEEPELTSAYAARACVHALRGDSKRADRDLEVVIERQPESADSIRLHQKVMECSIRFRLEQYPAVVQSANEALQLDPIHVHAHQMRATAYWYSSQFVEALDDFHWLEDHSEDKSECWSGLGQVSCELGEFDEALAYLDRALEAVNPTETTAAAYIRNGRGLALIGLGRTEEAFDELELSVIAAPTNAWAQFNLAMAYLQTQEPKKAAVCFRLALVLEGPRLTPQKRNRAKAFLAKMEPEANE